MNQKILLHSHRETSGDTRAGPKSGCRRLEGGRETAEARPAQLVGSEDDEEFEEPEELRKVTGAWAH